MVVWAGCSSGRPVEAVSLLGEPLVRPKLYGEQRDRLNDQMLAARADYRANPDNEMAAIWYGRRLSYLGRYHDAIGVYTNGLAAHPESYKLLRHRGHRYITIREFDLALADLSAASELVAGLPDEVEPDGMPNASNIPRSTTKSNIEYHLALAYYLTGDFEVALDAWTRCYVYSQSNDDSLVSASYWWYLTLRRVGRDDEANAVLVRITPDMDVIENGDYHGLLLFFKGEISEDELLPSALRGVQASTLSYGVGAWLLLEDRDEESRVWLRRAFVGPWAAFGYIAAEAEMARARPGAN